LTIGFENSVNSGKIREEIENSRLPQFDHLMDQTESRGDDDETWLDSATKPEFSFDQIGAEMAERVASYVSEVSEFDAVDADGPVNFDIDAFKDKLQHFLDSSESEEEEEEEEETELLDQLDDEQLLRSDRRACVRELLGQSFDAQPDRRSHRAVPAGARRPMTGTRGGHCGIVLSHQPRTRFSPHATHATAGVHFFSRLLTKGRQSGSKSHRAADVAHQ
jgi:hypothetical protein